MSRHIPVAAKRDVLHLYRWQRQFQNPYVAMQGLMHRFAVEYTDRQSNGDKFDKAQQSLARYRAARWYLYNVIYAEVGPRVRQRRDRLSQLAARNSEIAYHQRKLAELEGAAR